MMTWFIANDKRDNKLYFGFYMMITDVVIVKSHIYDLLKFIQIKIKQTNRMRMSKSFQFTNKPFTL
jgi:hypothetical protein